jgi:hypothetical protein
MLTLQNRLRDVPGGWSFIVYQTGENVHADTFNNLVYNVWKHMTVNDIGVPVDIGKIIEHDICKRIPPKLRSRMVNKEEQE